MRYLVLIICLCLSGCATHVPFDKEERDNQIVGSILLALDWKQTREIASDPGRYETNVVLGPHPSPRRINAYMAGGIFLYWAGAYISPKPLRKWGQKVLVMVETGVVTRNYMVGVRAEF